MRSSWKSAIAGAIILCGTILALPTVASAQTTNRDTPETGGGVATEQPGGGETVVVSGGKPIARPLSGPSASEFSASMEFESWKNDFKDGVSKGSRQTLLLGYTKAMGNNEANIIVPIQHLKVTGFQEATGLEDTTISFRHYAYNAADPNGVTCVYGVKGVLPTGNRVKSIGVGQWGIGPTVTVSKPFGQSLFYTGGSYTFIEQRFGATDPYFLWLGGVTQIQPKTNVQYELTRFRDARTSAQYLRLLVGPRFMISPTAGIQVNLKQELQNSARSTTISVGYSNRY